MRIRTQESLSCWKRHVGNQKCCQAPVQCPHHRTDAWLFWVLRTCLLEQLDTPIKTKPDTTPSANGNSGTRKGRELTLGIPEISLQHSSQLLASGLEDCFSKLARCSRSMITQSLFGTWFINTDLCILYKCKLHTCSQCIVYLYVLTQTGIMFHLIIIINNKPRQLLYH